jgi:hypothetical protein
MGGAAAGEVASQMAVDSIYDALSASEPQQRDAFARLLRDPGARPWDLLLHGQSAPWQHRNGRVFLEALLATGSPGNVGGFSDAGVDALIERALEAAVDAPPRALGAWQAVERRALELAAIVPLAWRPRMAATRHSRRVRDVRVLPALGYAPDLTAVSIGSASQRLVRSPLSTG